MEHPANETVVKKIPLNKPEQTLTEDQDAPETPNVASTQSVGFRCQIPSLWKRFKVKIIKFILLILIKSVLAIFVHKTFGISKIIYYAILSQDNFNMTYITVVEFIYKVFLLEVLQQIVFRLNRIFWLHSSTLFHVGVTICKALLGLTVVWLIVIQGQPNEKLKKTNVSNNSYLVSQHY